MSFCSGNVHQKGKQHHGPVNINLLARAVIVKIFRDVFVEGERHKKGSKNYRAAAAVGVGPLGPGEEGHHLVCQTARDYLGDNEQLNDVAREFGVDTLTQELIDSLIQHPLNVIGAPRGEHSEISKEYNSYDYDSRSSHLYEFVRVQDYDTQMVKGLDALSRHSPNAFADYLKKADYFGLTNFYEETTHG